MIKSIIVDDEPDNVVVLSRMLQEFCPEVSVLGEANNAHKAEAVIRQVHPDLVFLDIEMPYGNGFDILDRLRPVHFEVVFITAFNEYSLKAFRYNALDYLLKPVNIDELKEAVDKVGRNIRLKAFNGRLESFLQNLKKPSLALEKIALPAKKGVALIPINDIIRCEALRGYTSFIIKNREKIVSSKNIKEYEALLPEELFMRVHHSHLINLHSVVGYQWGRGGFVEMEDGHSIEVSARRKADLVERLGLARSG